MKKLLSVLLAVIMIFSCCTLAVNALYFKTSTTTTYADNLKPTESLTEVKAITYSEIIGNKGLYTQSELQNLYGVSALNQLEGNDFIEVISTVKSTTSEDVETVEIKDKNGNPTGNHITYSSTTVTNKQLEVLGVPVSFIYGDPTSTFFWKNLTAYPQYQEVKLDENKKPIPLADISKADISLLFGDVNMFLLRIMKSLYSDYRFYTDENAVKCINFIGNLFYPGFSEYADGSLIFSYRDYVYKETVNNVEVSYADEDIFFQKVSDLSGFTDLIQDNWVDYGEARSKYKPLISLLGVAEGDLLESEYLRGDKIGPAILSSAFTKIMAEGPVTYFLNIFESFTKGYLIYYYTPIKLLFSQKEHLISQEELKTITGLLNLIFNDNNRYNTDKYQFAPLPESKLGMITDKAELYLVLLVYLNLNTRYLSNSSVINNLKVTVDNSKISDRATTDENGKVTPGYQTRLIRIINGITSDHLEKMFYDGTLDSLTIENLSSKPSEFFGNAKEALSRMIKKIADWFQMWIDIFTGKLEFGAGAFD